MILDPWARGVCTYARCNRWFLQEYHLRPHPGGLICSLRGPWVVAEGIIYIYIYIHKSTINQFVSSYPSPAISTEGSAGLSPQPPVRRSWESPTLWCPCFSSCWYSLKVGEKKRGSPWVQMGQQDGGTYAAEHGRLACSSPCDKSPSLHNIPKETGENASSWTR